MINQHQSIATDEGPSTKGALMNTDASELLALPGSPLAREIQQMLASNASAAIANHSLRSYVFARLAADARKLSAGRDYDPELLFCACALHDIGLAPAFNRGQRFEVDGADTAAEVLARHGVPAADIDLVWQAVALNTSPGIVERRGTLCALTLAGVALDFGLDAAFVPDGVARRIHEAYPRLAIGRVLADRIVAQAEGHPAKAPLFSMPAQLLRERSTSPHVTEVERLATAGRWRE